MENVATRGAVIRLEERAEAFHTNGAGEIADSADRAHKASDEKEGMGLDRGWVDDRCGGVYFFFFKIRRWHQTY